MQLDKRNNRVLGGQRPSLILAILLFIATALFPFGWLATVSPGFDAVANFIFGTELAHIIGHYTVFVLMGSGVLLIFPSLRRHFWLYFGLMFLLAILQEFLQIASFKHYIPAWDEVLDLTVDLLGAGTGFYFLKR